MRVSKRAKTYQNQKSTKQVGLKLSNKMTNMRQPPSDKGGNIIKTPILFLDQVVQSCFGDKQSRVSLKHFSHGRYDEDPLVWPHRGLKQLRAVLKQHSLD